MIKRQLQNSSGGSRISRGGVHPLGGRGPPTWVLFGGNVCKNERIGSHRGWCAPGTPPPPDPPMNRYTVPNVDVNLYVPRELIWKGVAPQCDTALSRCLSHNTNYKSQLIKFTAFLVRNISLPSTYPESDLGRSPVLGTYPGIPSVPRVRDFGRSPTLGVGLIPIGEVSDSLDGLITV